MEIGEIRRSNLRVLLNTQGISHAKFARNLRPKTNPAYISQMLNSHGGRKMGNEIARRIERSHGLESGWMDQDRSEDARLPATAHALWALFERLPTSSKKHIRALMEHLVAKKK